MRNYLALAGLLLAVISSPAHAEAYYWLRYANGGLNEPTQYATPLAACKGSMSTDEWRAVAATSTTVFSCEVLRSDGWSTTTVEARRRGTECPPDTVYDDDTGHCVGAPQCADKAGQSFPFSRSGQAGDGELIWNIGVGGAAGNNWTLNSQDACNDGCAATVVRSKCAVRVSGSYVCGGTAEYSGAACPASTSGPVQPEPSESLPEPKTEQSSQPCVYETVPDGTMRCRSETSVDIEGQLCGEYDGKRLCVNRQPKSDGTTVDTTVQTETHADGSKTITKTDAATKQTCVGAGSCTSTTTTTTTTIHQDANGNKTGESSTCTGSACPSSDNPDGDGDGIGDCTDDNCGEGSGGPELEETPGFGESLNAFWGRLGDSPLISAVSGIRMNSGAGCQLPTSDATKIGAISMQPLCNNAHWLDPLYGIFLALHALAAVRVLLSA